MVKSAANANAVTLETATGVSVVAEEAGGGGGSVVATKQSGSYRGRVVVLAGGSYTAWLAAASGLTSIGPPPAADAPASSAAAAAAAAAVVTPNARSGVGSIRLSRRTVLLAEVTEAEAIGTLAGMPTVKYQFAPPPPTQSDASSSDSGSAAAAGAGGGGGNSHSRNEAMSVYVLPPIKYPGPDPPPGWYVKIGGGANDFFERNRWEETVRDVEAWMKSEGDEAVADRLHDVLLVGLYKLNPVDP